jgi:DNA recombination-dependent growth factor C
MYKAAQVFKLENFELNSSEFDLLLTPFHFRKMTPAQITSIGWVSPYGAELEDESLVRTVEEKHAITFKMSEKKLPNGILDEQVLIRFQELKKSNGPQKLDKKTKKELRETIKTEMLPNQKPESKCVNAYIDPESSYLVIEGTNAKDAEALITMLNRAFEAGDHEIKISPIRTTDSVTGIITNWVKDHSIIPQEVELGSKCSLSGQEGQVVKYDKHELSEDKLIKYITEDNMDVAELQIEYKEMLSFQLSSDLSIRGIKTLDGSEGKFGADDHDDGWEADFVLMTGIFAELYPCVISWFGGEADSYSDPE